MGGVAVCGDLTFLEEESRNLVGYKLSKAVFGQFDNPNNRLIIGVACLREGYKEVAYNVFESIMEEGPKQSNDHHFAYVRSLVEIAKLEAENGRFDEAYKHMRDALDVFPEKMNYMMSRVHLEVYLTYYCFQSNKKEQAFKQVEMICGKERERFESLRLEDAYELVGPGLCYAIHQWALFYAEEGEWGCAIAKLKEAFQYTPVLHQEFVTEAKELESQGELEGAFYCYEGCLPRCG